MRRSITTTLAILGLLCASHGYGASVTVTTVSDAVNGTITSISLLKANPGPDGISLREAMLASKNTPTTSGGPHNIQFDISLQESVKGSTASGDNWWRITPKTPLPQIGFVTIDGTSAKNINSQGPDIEIVGSLTPTSYGIDIRYSNCTIKGLVINGFASGITVTDNVYKGGKVTTKNVLIRDSYIGTDVFGTVSKGNGHGIFAYGMVENLYILKNVISGNKIDGIYLNGIGPSNPDDPKLHYITLANVLIHGNRVGTDRTGLLPLKNGQSGGTSPGLYVGSGGGIYATQVKNLLIEKNTISGNIGNGISIAESEFCFISQNIIGLDETGKKAIGNSQNGIFFDVLFGGGKWLLVSKNIISGNLGKGIYAAKSTLLFIQANSVGTDEKGFSKKGNGSDGIVIKNSDMVLIGGERWKAQGNVVSGNGSDGIALIGVKNFHIYGNNVGTDKDGLTAIGNAETGIHLGGSGYGIIGGPLASGAIGSPGNLISGNTKGGLRIGSSESVLVRGNFIGTKMDGEGLLANGNVYEAVSIYASVRILIGTYRREDGNIIVSDKDTGIDLEGKEQNYIWNNNIGMSLSRKKVGQFITGIKLDSPFGWPIEKNYILNNHIAYSKTGVEIKSSNAKWNLVFRNKFINIKS